MKKISLSLKYTIIFFTFFLITFIFLSKVFDVSNEALFYSSVIAFLVYLVSFVFIVFEISSPLKNLFRHSEKLKLDNEENESFDNFDEKIRILKEFSSQLKSVKSGFFMNKDIYSLTNELVSIVQRLQYEIETAKILKVNRNEFMGNVAHELRTPIFAIQLSLETLLDGAISDENVNMDFLNRAFNQTKRLKELVDDLINISRFEVGVKMSKRYFEIANSVVKIIEDLKSLADKKNISLILDTNGTNGVRVFGDEQNLQQALINLVDNAIKYTPEYGTIKISLKVKEKEVVVSVEDNGIGIPAKDLKRIFERFYRVDKNRSREIGGSGLGLSIVKHILEAHSSQIKVESEVNKGSRFEFSLNR
ncbi:MAG: Adaptive-response sensory-kinase SasA [Ignavibacteria bacterium]|nr:Adaptive-response sensory-kinase SasA [Ignavibacteria bacterium]